MENDRVLDMLILGIRRGRVVSVGDLKPGVPGSIPSRDTMVIILK